MNKIFIESTLDRLEGMLKKESQVFLVVDRNLEAYRSLFAPYPTIWLETSEEKKVMDTVLYLSGELLKLNADRKALLVGIGGGIVTDLTGFTASVYKRGIRAAFVPTTLLAQTDASIGGKNGVNLDDYKNILGTITLPEWVYICPEFLKTLPVREFYAGMAEVVKTLLVSSYSDYRKGTEIFIRMNRDFHLNYTLLDKDLLHLIQKCVRIKSGIVKRDLKEEGERRLLNFGHSFAHAIEKVAAERLESAHRPNHGEAVAIGMIMASVYACNRGLVERFLVTSLIRDFHEMGLPTCIPGIGISEILETMKKDKKVFRDEIHLILPNADNDELIIRDCPVALKELTPERFER